MFQHLKVNYHQGHKYNIMFMGEGRGVIGIECGLNVSQHKIFLLHCIPVYSVVLRLGPNQ